MFGRFLPFWILLEQKLAVSATFKINNCQFCHLSGYFQIPLLKFSCTDQWTSRVRTMYMRVWLEIFQQQLLSPAPPSVTSLPFHWKLRLLDAIRLSGAEETAVATAQLLGHLQLSCGWKSEGETLHEHGFNFVWCSNMFQLDLWWSLILSHILFVGSEEWIQFSVFSWSCLGYFNSLVNPC